MHVISDTNQDNKRISTALLLAAGIGSRLYPLTKDSPKCLTLVNEVSIIERLVVNLKEQGFTKLVIVTGFRKECIIDFLGHQSGNLSIEYMESPLYKTTNNIYSLWMVRSIIKEPFVLIESDLVLSTPLLNDMVIPDRIAVAKMQPWLNGTTVSINSQNQVTEFQKGTTETYTDTRYKTVNIYSFSLSSWKAIVKLLDKYITDGNVNCYYETVFMELVANGSLLLESVSFDHQPWYEIDTVYDLSEAEKLFSKELEEQEVLVELTM